VKLSLAVVRARPPAILAQISNSVAGVTGGSQLDLNSQTDNLAFDVGRMIEGTSLSSTCTVCMLQAAAHNGWLTTLAGRFSCAADNRLKQFEFRSL
jgi:hypothetical protein